MSGTLKLYSILNDEKWHNDKKSGTEIAHYSLQLTKSILYLLIFSALASQSDL